MQFLTKNAWDQFYAMNILHHWNDNLDHIQKIQKHLFVIAIRPTKGQCKEQQNENEVRDVFLRKKPGQLLFNVEVQELKVSLGLKILYDKV